MHEHKHSHMKISSRHPIAGAPARTRSMMTNTEDQRRRRVGKQDVGEELAGSGAADEGHGIGFPVGETERVYSMLGS
jgi:hypothetical protein